MHTPSSKLNGTGSRPKLDHLPVGMQCKWERMSLSHVEPNRGGLCVLQSTQKNRPVTFLDALPMTCVNHHGLNLINGSGIFSAEFSIKNIIKNLPLYLTGVKQNVADGCIITALEFLRLKSILWDPKNGCVREQIVAIITLLPSTKSKQLANRHFLKLAHLQCLPQKRNKLFPQIICCYMLYL